MKTEHIYKGDNLEVLKDFSDESIDCVVTSPPYWGLRDYGTAEWEGGDESCNHIKFNIDNMTEKQKSSKGSWSLQYKNKCKDCGAIRKDKQLGLEETPEEFVGNLVRLFSEVKRVLKKEGTVWLNLGDSYIGGGRGYDYCKDGTVQMNHIKAGVKYGKPTGKIKGLKSKDLTGIPWRVAFALQEDGWYLRQDIIWHKPNPMPESVQDRCTKSHEYIFLLTKSPKYFYDIDAIKEKATTGEHTRNRESNFKKHSKIDGRYVGGNRGETIKCDGMRNKRSVWTITTKPYREAHFATFPIELPTYCIKAGCPEGGIVLDPFFGSGTTGLAAQEHNRHWVGIELNEEYIEIAKKRTSQTTLFI